MSPTIIGMAVAAVLAISWATFGFWPFIGIGIAIAIGALIGRVVEGKLDPTDLVASISGKRSSS